MRRISQMQVDGAILFERVSNAPNYWVTSISPAYTVWPPSGST